MSIRNFKGKTFVAFLDISGFKKLMREMEEKAWRALDKLYRTGFDEIQRNRRESDLRIDGIFVSDSGILFIRNERQESDALALEILLKTIEKINKKMLEDNFMLTTSIAYGYFRYQDRIEFEGIEKNPVFGDAYLSAFFDNENGKPKIRPGQCRIVKKGLPQIVVSKIRDGRGNIFPRVRKRERDKNHFYFYWMIDKPQQAEIVEKGYKENCKSKNCNYSAILNILKGSWNEL